MLSDEKLLEIYNANTRPTQSVMASIYAGLRAVAEAAVKDAVGGEAWKHDCAALLTNDVEFWIASCPHCGKPRPQASAAVPEDWREVMQGLVECARDEIVRCEGMKCREPNCISCNDELEATTSVERSREFVFRARAMLAVIAAHIAKQGGVA